MLNSIFSPCWNWVICGPHADLPWLAAPLRGPWCFWEKHGNFRREKRKIHGKYVWFMNDLWMIYENHGKSPTIMENPHDLQNISPSAQVRVSRFYQTTLLQLRAPDLSGHCRTSTETWHAWTRTHGRECQTVRIYVRWNARTPEWMPERMSNYIIFQGFFSTRSFQ